MKALVAVLFLALSAHAAPVPLPAPTPLPARSVPTALVATPETCISTTDVQALSKDFNFEFHNPQFRSLDLCDARALSYKLLKALLYLRDLPQVSVTPDEFDQNIMGGNLYDYFRTRIRHVSFEASAGECSIAYAENQPVFGTLAFVNLRERLHRMHICPYAQFFGVSDLVPVLVHEARHEEGYPHVLCTHGIYQVHDVPGSPGSCDTSYGEKGSYGVGVEYQVDLVRMKTLDPMVRQGARAQAMADFFNRFNQMPIGLKEGALLKSSNGNLSFYDGQQLQIMAKAEASDLLAGGVSTLQIFRPQDGDVNTLDLYGRWQSVVGSLPEYFTSKVTSAEQKELLDVSYGSNYSCMLFSRRLLCLGNDNSVASISLQQIKPLSLVSLKNSVLLKPGAISIVDESGYLYMLPLETQLLVTARESDFIKSAVPVSFVKAASWQTGSDLSLLLNRLGQVQFYSEKSRRISPAPGLQGQNFDSMMSPYTWSSELQQL